MLGLLNPLNWFGGGKTTEKAIDTASSMLEHAASGVDKMFYTEEERADDAKETFKAKATARMEAWRIWVQALAAEQDANTPRSRTRRYLAIAITTNWLVMVNVAAGLLAFGKVEQALPLLDFLGVMTVAVGAVLTFYFGPNQIAGAAAKFMQMKHSLSDKPKAPAE